MPRKIQKFTLFFLLAIFSSYTHSDWFGGPNDYDECILENMKGVESNAAAYSIRKSCRKKFPEESNNEKLVPLPPEVLKTIDGKAFMTSYGWFKGSIFNGSENWHIASLRIRITDNVLETSRDYHTSFSTPSSPHISPLSRGEFSFKPFDVPSDMTWAILSGEGYPK